MLQKFREPDCLHYNAVKNLTNHITPTACSLLPKSRPTSSASTRWNIQHFSGERTLRIHQNTPFPVKKNYEKGLAPSLYSYTRWRGVPPPNNPLSSANKPSGSAPASSKNSSQLQAAAGCDRATMTGVYRCRREGFVESGDDCGVCGGDRSTSQTPLSQSCSLLNTMSFAIHLASGRPNT